MEDERELQPSSDYISGGQAMMNFQNLAIFVLDSSRLIELIAHDLMGEIPTVDGWQKVSKALMNKEGIQTVKSILNSYINPNIFLSIFSKQEIYNKCKDLEYDINELIALKHGQFKIEEAYFFIIRDKIMTQVHASLNRAMEISKETGSKFGMMLQALTQQVQIRQSTVTGDKRGGISLFGRKPEGGK